MKSGLTFQVDRVKSVAIAVGRNRTKKKLSHEVKKMCTKPWQPLGPLLKVKLLVGYIFRVKSH